MAFGKNLSQNNEAVSPNNYCGGFAMSAILTDSEKPNEGPMAVYGNIQKLQQDVTSGPLFELVESMKQYGSNTNICLPSSLVNIAREAEFVVNLKYSDSLKFGEDVIQAEVERCGEGTAEEVGTEDIFDCFSKQEIKYYLVMVNNCHWIAVKRKTKGDGFSVYEPATGGNKKFEKVQDMLQNWAASYKNAGAIIITLYQ